MHDIIRLGLAIYLFSALFGWVENFITLRWIVFIGVAYLIYLLIFREVIERRYKQFFLIWFGIILFLFNPLFPIYLYDIFLWRTIDFIVALSLILKPIFTNIVGKEYVNRVRFTEGMMDDDEHKRYLDEVMKYEKNEHFSQPKIRAEDLREEARELAVLLSSSYHEKPNLDSDLTVEKIKEIVDGLESTRIKRTAIYSYASFILTNNQYKVIEQIEELPESSQDILWELLKSSEGAQKVVYSDDNHSIESLLDVNLVSWEIDYYGEQRELHLIPQSKKVFEYLVTFTSSTFI